MSSSLALLLAAVLLAVIVAVHLRYRLTHPHTTDDLDAARKDAAKRSGAVRIGKTSEHLYPLFPEFRGQFDLEDARFIGAPIDYLVFDGLCSGGLETVRFVELKTGNSQLNKRERQVRDAILDGRVEWELIKLDSPAAVRNGGPGLTEPADE